eukprot:CAMPEP_0185262998 /NCGR_PEP_ID=MMETSP1359-20130426/10995_1 /TAXON_ID=552665 /ORGANISM="Bigelowiella longifila, Strain CCMP242" /LENGTH=538 /DNA_ID=CAMNT_0027850081 /DNA_START=56 /DNA_END=1673 /DNA_ORIENTATION=+
MPFTEGEKITIVGLTKGVKYNYTHGTICGPFKEGRWPVRLIDSEKVLNVRPRNLVGRNYELKDQTKASKIREESGPARSPVAASTPPGSSPPPADPPRTSSSLQDDDKSKPYASLEDVKQSGGEGKERNGKEMKGREEEGPGKTKPSETENSAPLDDPAMAARQAKNRGKNAALANTTQLQELSLKDLDMDTVLGVGSFSTVRKARVNSASADCPLNECDVAVKLVERRKIDKGRDQQRHTLMIQRELECLKELNKLQHPFIVRLYAYFATSVNYAFVLYMCGGVDLCSLVVKHTKDERLDLNTSRYYVACVLDAVDAMHGANICHRDLKPDNIMLDTSHRPVIIDFGCASELKGYDVPGDTNFAGTPQYMAPEAIQNKAKDRRMVDYWACGCLLHFLVSGEHLFDGDSDYLVMLKVEKADVEINERCPEESHDVINAFCDPDPSKRLGVEGCQQAKAHAFFKSIDFKSIGTLAPPDPTTQNATRDDRPIRPWRLESSSRYNKYFVAEDQILQGGVGSLLGAEKSSLLKKRKWCAVRV